MTLAAGQRVHECRTARVYAAAFAVMGAISGTVALVDLQRGRVLSAGAGWAAVLGVAALLAVGFLELEGSVASELRRDVFRLRARAE